MGRRRNEYGRQNGTPPRWQQDVAERVLELIREANCGQWPQNIWHWRKVARHFGVQICLVNPEVLQEPLLRRGVLYLPRVRQQPCKLQRFLTHEISEACLQWEGEPPYCYTPPEPVRRVRHEIARCVEQQVPCP